MFAYKKTYFVWAAILFVAEVFIALFVRDSIIRPYGGDFLVVIFLYCLIRSFLKISVVQAVVAVLCFAYVIEWMQYLELTTKFGLDGNPVVATVLGNHFEWLDILLYSLGICSVLLYEFFLTKRGEGDL